MSDENLALDMDKPLHRALDFWAGIDGSDSKAVGEALSALSLSHLADVPVRMLSTGQRKRAMLARVVSAKAPLCLFDYPANALSASSLLLLVVLFLLLLAFFFCSSSFSVLFFLFFFFFFFSFSF